MPHYNKMELKVVTFNLRMNTMRDGEQYFFYRAPYILEKIQNERPDVIGFQEATREIHAWLSEHLSDYTVVGVGRGSDFSDEANPIAFLTSRFELFGMTQYWLSPTPEIPGSRYAHQSACPRVAVSVKLLDKKSKEVFRFYNTHLDHIDAKARLLGINQILAQIKEEYCRSPHPVILTGDMNATPDEVSMTAVSALDSPHLVDAAGNVKTTFHGYCGGDPYEGSVKIDYIFTNLVEEAIACDVWCDCNNGLWLSDHYPIAAVLNT